jgi:Tol biopolymer transport system component
MSINNINSKLDIRPVSQIGESYRWSAVLLILVILILELNTSQASGDDVQRMRPTLLIGYSECRNDLPDGQYANWLTKRSYVVCADGTKRREIGGEIIQDQYSWTQFGGWSPDGSKAVLLSARETPENAAWERKNKTFRMTQGWLMDACLLDLASGQLTNVSAVDRVSNYNSVSFTPDGRKLLMTSLIDGVSRPFIMELDGHSKRDISAGGAGFAYGLSSSPDGQLVAYHEDYQIYVSKADGSQRQHIETGNPFNFVPQWSPDGQWLLFLSGEHYNCHPHLSRKDGSEIHKLADRGGYSGVVEVLRHPDFHSASSDIPSWSIDGQSIYFTAQVGESVELMRAELNGNLTQLTFSQPGTRHYHPAVSPDGKWVLFGSDRSGTMQLYVASTTGQECWPITNVPASHCAMHGHWEPAATNQANTSEKQVQPPQTESPTIVTAAQSSKDYTRKSEGDVIELEEGRLLLVYMEFSGDGSDFAKTRLVAQESSDGGLTWQGHRVITETARGDMNVYSPNLIRAQDGGILLIFMRQHGHDARTCYVWKSNDEGISFSPLSEFFPKQDFSLCNATIKRLDSGRLLLPASPPVAGQPTATGPYSAVVLYSDDDGQSWQVSRSRITLPKRGAMEPHVEQAADGRVLMVMRNQLGKLYFSQSNDEGVSWSDPFASDLDTPESCPEITRIPGSQDLLMVWNNTFDADFRSHYGKRSPLAAAISKDHGRSWQSIRDIETDPTRAFSNPGCRFTRSGKAIINYWTCQYLPDWRMQDAIDLRVAIIDKSWFYGAASPLDKDRADASGSKVTPR